MERLVWNAYVSRPGFAHAQYLRRVADEPRRSIFTAFTASDFAPFARVDGVDRSAHAPKIATPTAGGESP